MSHDQPENRTDHHPSKRLEQLASLAREAGAAVLEIYQQADLGVRYKDDRSPLTEADLASHQRILNGLRKLDPERPVLSEEGRDLPYAERRGWQSFWLVDPLDGTKEFIKRNGEFTINIALIEDGVPTLGVVYAPVLDRTYLAEEGHAWRQDGGGKRRRIHARGTDQQNGPLAIVASRSHPSPELTAFLGEMPPHRLVNMGSSLKLCLVAEAEADFYPRLGPTMEWDTGAAHAIVRAAGGEVYDVSGKPLRYNKENLLNPYFLAIGEAEVPWREALERTGLATEKAGG